MARRELLESLAEAFQHHWPEEDEVHEQQDLITALVAQDFMGGDLLVAPAGAGLHYMNQMGLCYIDFTRNPLQVRGVGRAEAVERREVLQDRTVRKSYRALQAKVSASLQEAGLERKP